VIKRPYIGQKRIKHNKFLIFPKRCRIEDRTFEIRWLSRETYEEEFYTAYPFFGIPRWHIKRFIDPVFGTAVDIAEGNNVETVADDNPTSVYSRDSF
jgi:hypothetical protein